MIRALFRCFRVLMIVVVLGISGHAMAGQISEIRGLGFFGTVKAVDCDTGEMKVRGRNGEVLFHLDRETKYRYVKGCEEIAPGGVVLIRFEDDEGRKVARVVKYRARRAAGTGKADGSARKGRLFMGWVDTADCDKGVITLENTRQKGEKVTFHLSDKTVFDPGRGLKGCGDIRKGSIVALVYQEEKEGKIVRKMRLMAAQRREP